MFYRFIVTVINLFPNWLQPILYTLFWCWVTFTIGAIVYCAIKVVNYVRGVVHFV